MEQTRVSDDDCKRCASLETPKNRLFFAGHSDVDEAESTHVAKKQRDTSKHFGRAVNCSCEQERTG